MWIYSPNYEATSFINIAARRRWHANISHTFTAIYILATDSLHGLMFLHCRKMVLQYGLWYQIQTDQWKEWNLLLFVSNSLSTSGMTCSKPPHLQSTSRQVQQPTFIFHYSIKFHCALMIVYRITWTHMGGNKSLVNNQKCTHQHDAKWRHLWMMTGINFVCPGLPSKLQLLEFSCLLHHGMSIQYQV